MCFRICRRSSDDAVSSRLDGLDKSLRSMSQAYQQHKTNHASVKRAILTYSMLIVLPLLATLYALPIMSTRHKSIVAVAAPVLCYLLYVSVDWWYSRRIRMDKELMERMQVDMEETLREFKEKINFPEMIRRMAQYEQVVRATLSQPIGPPPEKVELITPMKVNNRNPYETPSKTPAVRAQAAQPAPSTGKAARNAAAANVVSPSESEIVEPVVPNTPAGADLATQLQIARAETQAVQMEFNTMRQQAMQAQASLLHQLASLQDNSRAGPAPHIAAQMVAGGLTAADIQQLQQNGSGNAPPTRTALDKVVDYVLGEGPNSRYALMCKHCYAHNGLVLPDDLSRARYRCMRCHGLNGDFSQLLQAADKSGVATTPRAKRLDDVAEEEPETPTSTTAKRESKKKQ